MFEMIHLYFNRNRETAREQIIRVYSEQMSQPKRVKSVAVVIENWGYTHKSHLVATRIPEFHRHGHIDPFESNLEKCFN